MDSILIIGLGQPMVDLIGEVSEEFLEKYNLEKNSAIRADDSHHLLFQAMKKHPDIKYTPGGSTTNTLRITSNLMKKTGKQVGCIGKFKNYLPF